MQARNENKSDEPNKHVYTVMINTNTNSNSKSHLNLKYSVDFEKEAANSSLNQSIDGKITFSCTQRLEFIRVNEIKYSLIQPFAKSLKSTLLLTQI